MHGEYAYGNWGIVITMILVSIFFILKFIPMRTRLGKRSGGMLMAFIGALFMEMYGFPLTIYLLSHFVGVKIPFDHISGHLLGDLISSIGLGNGWFIVMLVSTCMIFIGVWMITDGWERVYKSDGNLVTDGIYAYMRHPQYMGIFTITIGFMIQWPTLSTLVLWPFVISMYIKLAKKEEKDVMKQYPQQYRLYMQQTPMFFPKIFWTRQPASKAR